MNRAIFISTVMASCGEQAAREVELAYLLTKKIHQGQVRKEVGPDGLPLRYFEHLRRTALVMLDAGIQKPELIIAGLLHDSIEDTAELQLVSILIERLFGKEVAGLVRSVSKTPKVGYIDRLSKSIEIYAGLPAVVKAADRLDNLRSLPVDNKVFSDKQRKETRDIYLPIFFKAESLLAEPIKSAYKNIVSDIVGLC